MWCGIKKEYYWQIEMPKKNSKIEGKTTDQADRNRWVMLEASNAGCG